MRHRVSVRWRVSGEVETTTTVVALTDGYSDVTDIPKILAIRYLPSVLSASEIRVLSVTALTSEEI